MTNPNSLLCNANVHHRVKDSPSILSDNMHELNHCEKEQVILCRHDVLKYVCDFIYSKEVRNVRE